MAAICAWRSSSDCSSLIASSRFLITSSFCRQMSSNDDSCEWMKTRLAVSKVFVSVQIWNTEIIVRWSSRSCKQNYQKQIKYTVVYFLLYTGLLFCKHLLPTPTLHCPLHTQAIHKHQPYAIIPSVLSLLLFYHFSGIRFSLVDRRYSFRSVSSLLLVSEGLYGAL